MPAKSSKPSASSATTASKGSAPTTVAGLLQRRRNHLGISLATVERATRIRGKYLRQLEAGDYSQLPHDVYSRGFVQSYATYLGLDPHETVRRYEAERGGPPDAPRRVLRMAQTRTTVVPQLIALLAVVGLIAGIGIYLSLQFRSLTGAPALEVTSPAADQSLYGGVIDVRGKASGGADVTVNESPLLTDSNGEFSDKIALQNGINSIRVTAKNRLGRSTTVTRNILATVPQPGPETQLPAAPFDGVAVALTVSNAATKVQVRADGAEVFNGTMLPGTTQLFRANAKITVSTASAANTGVTVTNSTVANRAISPLGATSEAKQDLEFAKDTAFQ